MDFAVSVAAAFNAHLAGIAFVYAPIMPVMIDMYGIPPEVIELQRVENEGRQRPPSPGWTKRRAMQALPTEAHMLDRPRATAPGVFASLARRFDLSIVGQPEPDSRHLTG